MKKYIKLGFLVCGLAFGLAAFPVFAQNDATPDVAVNEKPFHDWASMVKNKIEISKTDLTKPFLVELEGFIDKDGRFDRGRSKFIRIEGDQQVASFGKSFIEAAGDSGILVYLQRQGVEKINLTLAQDNTQTFLKVVSEQESPERATRTANGLESTFNLLKLIDFQGIKRLDENSRFLVQGAKASSDGNKMILEFSFPKAAAHQMITRALEKYK